VALVLGDRKLWWPPQVGGVSDAGTRPGPADRAAVGV
jgi:hypothetical protein